jgi:hypothetical protein
MTEVAMNSLGKKTNLSELDVSDNDIGDEGIAAFKDNKNLRILKACNCNITYVGLAQLVKNRTIDELWLNNNSICDAANENDFTKPDGAEILARSNYRVLKLENCNVGLRGAKAFGASPNPRLIILDLSNNRFGDAGMKPLSQNGTVWRIFLNVNNITDVGFIELIKSKSLIEVYVTRNKITDNGLTTFIAENKTITLLVIHSNPYQPPMLDRVNKKLEENSQPALQRQSEFNVNLYAFHRARHIHHEKKTPAGQWPAFLTHFFTLPDELQLHIFSFIEFPYLQKTPDEMLRQYKFLASCYASLHHAISTKKSETPMRMIVSQYEEQQATIPAPSS